MQGRFLLKTIQTDPISEPGTLCINEPEPSPESIEKDSELDKKKFQS